MIDTSDYYECRALGDLFNILDIVPDEMAYPKSAMTPEKKLCFAILWGAVIEWRNCIGEPGIKPRKAIADIRRWMRSRRIDWTFSFVNICELFGLDPRAVSQALERMAHEEQADRVPRFYHRSAA